MVSGHLSPFRARLLSGTSWKAGRYVQVSKVGAHVKLEHMVLL